uniref:Uncharacterized protein n=1 Tax=Picea glauca TaxID=3330 RepID=A0A117NFF8_PICGL|nr:hypothetical protein ABT39_MTgene3600 [Picea glauca]
MGCPFVGCSTVYARCRGIGATKCLGFSPQICALSPCFLLSFNLCPVVCCVYFIGISMLRFSNK